MSNATQPSQQPGESRRRRSRGGKNRNRNNQNNRRDQRDPQSNRSEEFRPNGPRKPRGTRKVELKWWQKLLKAIGLYKAPAAPERPKRQESAPSRGDSAPKSNTRNARRDGEERNERNDRNDRPERSDKPQRQRQDQGERSPKRSRGGDPSTVESNRVYIGNLSYDVTEQDLQELLKGVGPVRNVEIVYNRSTHRSKGYGFVEMLQRDDAVRAVEVLHDQPFMGRNMVVSGAKSKEQEADEQQEAESRPLVASEVKLAPLPEFPSTEAPAAVAQVAEPASASAQEIADDLVAKYGFEEEKKSSDPS